MELVSEQAIVTGGAQGIGRAVTEELLRQGTSVAIADLDHDGAQDAAAELADAHDADAVAIQCDVSDEASVQAMVAEAVDELGEVGILVNNAGGSGMARTWEMPAKEWERTIDVCLNGTFYGSKAVVEHMLAADIEGAIVNTSSLNYTAGTDGLAHYSAAKAGVSQFTEVLAAEAGRYGIRVNAVAPGSTRTPAIEDVLVGKMRDEFVKRTPLGRIGEPEDVAKVVAFLLSDYGYWVTGETICVDGGQHVRGYHSYWDTLAEMGLFDE